MGEAVGVKSKEEVQMILAFGLLLRCVQRKTSNSFA